MAPRASSGPASELHNDVVRGDILKAPHNHNSPAVVIYSNLMEQKVPSKHCWHMEIAASILLNMFK